MTRRWWRGIPLSVWLVFGTVGPAVAGDPSQSLQSAGRLACAFVNGMTAAFSSRGGPRLRPPLDPNRPGLSIDLTERAKGRAVLEVGEQQEPGTLFDTPIGLSIVARAPSGAVTLVTVYSQYAGLTDNFLMVASRHGAELHPQMTQRYGVCRLAAPRRPTPPPAPVPHKE